MHSLDRLNAINDYLKKKKGKNYAFGSILYVMRFVHTCFLKLRAKHFELYFRDIEVHNLASWAIDLGDIGLSESGHRKI